MIFKHFLALTVLTLSVNLQANSSYDGVHPRSEEEANQICTSQGGDFIGSIALIKTENGELHPLGPNREEVRENFEILSNLLSSSGSQVSAAYGQAENWDWLEARFICYYSQDDALSFILRARSRGKTFGIRSYELTYLYSTSEVILENNRFDLTSASIGEATSSGLSINGLTEEPLDSLFVKSVLNVVLNGLDDVGTHLP